MGSYPTVPLYHEVFPAWCLNFPGAMATQWQRNGNAMTTRKTKDNVKNVAVCVQWCLSSSLFSPLPFPSFLFSSLLVSSFLLSLSLSLLPCTMLAKTEAHWTQNRASEINEVARKQMNCHKASKFPRSPFLSTPAEPTVEAGPMQIPASSCSQQKVPSGPLTSEIFDLLKISQNDLRKL